LSSIGVTNNKYLITYKGGKMSILTKPYEISVWEDVLEEGRIVEKRLGIIGSDKMLS
jgi:hypothetical protein